MENKIEISTENVKLKMEKIELKENALILTEGFLYLLIFIIGMELVSWLFDIPRIYGVVVVFLALLMVWKEMRILKASVQRDKEAII